MSTAVGGFAVLLVVTALLAWANERYTHIPTTVGVTLAGALASIGLITLDRFGLTFGLRTELAHLLETLDFTDFVLNGILSFLLFAGAMSLNACQMLRQRRSILTLAFVSTAISTALMGLAAYAVFRLVGLDVPLLWCFLFGALISPTDPVAVLDLLKRTKIPDRVRILIAGESLFNDGIGVVFFIVIGSLVGIGHTTPEPGLSTAALVFAQEALGGIAFGLGLGFICYQLCASIEAHALEVLITVATVVGGYVAAVDLGLSGPLAMVVAGLIMSWGKDVAFHGATAHHVEGFWGTLDEILNILLFAFIGLDVLLTETTGAQIVASALLIIAALLARFISVGAAMPFVRSRDGYGPWTVRVLTWGGLRGGIAISLALGLPGDSPYRTHLVTVTYAIVIFTIAVQGLTMMPLVDRVIEADPSPSDQPAI